MEVMDVAAMWYVDLYPTLCQKPEAWIRRHLYRNRSQAFLFDMALMNYLNHILLKRTKLHAYFELKRRTSGFVAAFMKERC
jgi:hypothetical protein